MLVLIGECRGIERKNGTIEATGDRSAFAYNYQVVHVLHGITVNGVRLNDDYLGDVPRVGETVSFQVEPNPNSSKTWQYRTSANVTLDQLESELEPAPVRATA